MLPSKPQFFGVRAAAANLSQGRGSYTAELFQADFPQFFDAAQMPLLPPAILDGLLAQANAAISPERWGDGWRYAAGLHTAHYAALFLRTYSESSSTPAQAAASGAL